MDKKAEEEFDRKIGEVSRQESGFWIQWKEHIKEAMRPWWEETKSEFVDMMKQKWKESMEGKKNVRKG